MRVALRLLPYRDVQVYVQVVFDLLVITGLIYLTGGPGNRAGFMLLYPISVLSGSVLLYRRKSLLLAGVATLFYAAMLVGRPRRLDRRGRASPTSPTCPSSTSCIRSS